MTRYSVSPLPEWPIGGVSPDVLSDEIAAWAGSRALAALVEAFGGAVAALAHVAYHLGAIRQKVAAVTGAT